MQKFYLITLLVLQLSIFAGNKIPFKENKNQWPEYVLFGANYKTTQFFVEKTGFNFCILDGNDLKKSHDASHTQKNDEDKNNINNKSVVKGHNYSILFNNASFSTFTKPAPIKEYYNYFLGNDESKWAGNVKAYEELLFQNIYKNIDLKLYSNDNNIKYDFILKPHADIKQIKLQYNNIDKLTLKNGNLIVETSVGQIIEQKPFAYQIIKGKKIEVKCEYVLNNNTLTYKLTSNYNSNYELTIDPTVIVCGYSNTSSNSFCSGSNFDKAGNIFVYGNANSGYPTTPGAFQATLGDIVISKYNTTGTIKIFSTYIGGS